MFRRPGLARSEVVLLLVISVLVVGLLLTAIQRVRDSAARMSCQNNLKQLGIGVHCYYDVNQRLPPLTDQGTGAPTGGGLVSVFATIAPYLEALPRMYHHEQSPPNAYHAPSSVHFPFRGKDEAQHVQFGGDANQIRRTFTDPADLTANQLRDVAMTLPDGTTGYYAAGSYAANGLLQWGSKGEPKSLAEWSPSAILFAERPQVCQPATGDAVHNLWGVGFYSPQTPAFATLTPTDPPGLWPTGQIAPVVPLPQDTTSEVRIRIGRADAEPQPVDFPTPIQIVRQGQSCDPRLPGSPHRAGMQATMTDGSARVFAPDTEPWVFWTACSPVAWVGGRK
jgi:hypothetical protein